MSEVIYNDYFFNFLYNTKARRNFLVGGGGSGKSTSLHQFFCIDKFINGDHLEILVTRKTMAWLRLRTYKKMIELLDNTLGSKNYYHNKSEGYITYKTNIMQFSGLDNSEKIKSTEWDYIFAEELTDYTEDDFQMLNLRLNRSKGNPQIFGAFNPIDEFIWIKTGYYDKLDDNTAFHHSTYRHNPFISQATKDEYRSLKEQNKRLWLIYSEGEWGSLDSLIYSNYKIEDTFPEHFDDIIYGYDFGYSNPSAIIKIGILDNELYLEELLYEDSLTSDMFCDRVESLGIDKSSSQYADSNRPDYIDVLYDRGYNVSGAEKGPGSVITGIDIVKKQKLHVLSSSASLVKELRAYSFKKDRNDHVIDEPVKFNDHLCLSGKTLIATNKGMIPIAHIKVGNKVLASDGYCEVCASGCSGVKTTYNYLFTNGIALRATSDHPLVINNSIIPLNTLRYSDIITFVDHLDINYKGGFLCQKLSNLTDLNFIGIQNQKITPIEYIIIQQLANSNMGFGDYMNISGISIMETFQEDAPFIIRMVTLSTIISEILNVLQEVDIPQYIKKGFTKDFQIKLLVKLLSGIKQTLEGYGIASTQKSKDLGIGDLKRLNASIAELNIKQQSLPIINIVQTLVNHLQEENQVQIISKGFAWLAQKLLQLINISRLGFAQNHVLAYSEERKTRVYNLTVDRKHEYFANGILVSNCDAMRYAIMEHIESTTDHIGMY